MEETNREAEIHALVGTELTIDRSDRIWRIAERRGQARVLVRVARRRAEKLIPNGYLQIRARFGGRGTRVHVYAHRLVWFHFNGPIGTGVEINHRNGVKSDNRPANLDAVTPKENQIHSRDVLGSLRTGERHRWAKLTAAKVKTIRERVERGERIAHVARAYGVSRTAIYHLVARRTWNSIR